MGYKKRSALLATAVTASAGPAGAHPGHGGVEAAPWSIWHYLLEPEHVVVGTFALCALVAYMWVRRWRVRRAFNR